MKTGKLIIFISLVAVLASGCGRNNQSGGGSPAGVGAWPFSNPLGSGIGQINSPFNFNGVSVNQVMAENPCISGFGGFNGPGVSGPYGGQRFQMQIPLPNFPTVISPNDIYVGITSYGDVGVIAGGPSPVFIGYMCPRSFTQTQGGQFQGVQLGSYTQCMIKPIVAASVAFPGGGSADFRMMDYGSSVGRSFSFCRR